MSIESNIQKMYDEDIKMPKGKEKKAKKKETFRTISGARLIEEDVNRLMKKKRKK